MSKDRGKKRTVSPDEQKKKTYRKTQNILIDYNCLYSKIYAISLYIFVSVLPARIVYLVNCIADVQQNSVRITESEVWHKKKNLEINKQQQQQKLLIIS